MNSETNVSALEELRLYMVKLEQRLNDVLLTQKEMLSFDEAIRYMNLSASYLYKLNAARIIEHFKPGGKLVYFRRADLDAWMQTGKCSSAATLKTQAINLLDKKKK
ncbi:MAG: helix-turn-helix domain-containing protein [Bacteroidia bacterium]